MLLSRFFDANTRVTYVQGHVSSEAEIRQMRMTVRPSAQASGGFEVQLSSCRDSAWHRAREGEIHAYLVKLAGIGLGSAELWGKLDSQIDIVADGPANEMSDAPYEDIQAEHGSGICWRVIGEELASERRIVFIRAFDQPDLAFTAATFRCHTCRYRFDRYLRVGVGARITAKRSRISKHACSDRSDFGMRAENWVAVEDSERG